MVGGVYVSISYVCVAPMFLLLYFENKPEAIDQLSVPDPNKLCQFRCIIGRVVAVLGSVLLLRAKQVCPQSVVCGSDPLKKCHQVGAKRFNSAKEDVISRAE